MAARMGPTMWPAHNRTCAAGPPRPALFSSSGNSTPAAPSMAKRQCTSSACLYLQRAARGVAG